MPNNQKVSICLALLALFVGCGSSDLRHPQPSQPKVPSEWHNAPTGKSIHTPSDQKWFETFSNTRLNALIAEALQKNSDLAIAGYRLEQAKINTALAHNTLVPSLSGGAGIGAAKLLTGNEKSIKSASAFLRVGYEADLWGKLAKAESIQEWEAMATEQDLRSTALSISGDTAILYWQLAYANEKYRINSENIQKSEQTLRLIGVKYKAGAATNLDLISAERTVISHQATAQFISHEIEKSRNALAILLDAPPSAHISGEPKRFPLSGLAPVKAGIPATLLANRPDVKAAQLRLKKFIGAIEIADANFYPTFNLTGTLGTQSILLSKILADPTGAVALDMVLPFLNWNENRLLLKSSKIAYEEAKVHFRQTLYIAMMEVENGLSANARYSAEAEALLRSWQNAKEQERLYGVQYEAGAVELKYLLDAQEASRQAELLYLESRYRLYVNRVGLALALGGA